MTESDRQSVIPIEYKRMYKILSLAGGFPIEVDSVNGSFVYEKSNQKLIRSIFISLIYFGIGMGVFLASTFGSSINPFTSML